MHRPTRNAVALCFGLVVLALGGGWLFGQLRSLPRGGALAARAEQRVVTLEVGGMTCGACAATVKSSLAGVPGVATAEVRYAQKRAYIVCDRGVADTALVQAVNRSGPGFLAVVATR